MHSGKIPKFYHKRGILCQFTVKIVKNDCFYETFSLNKRELQVLVLR